MSKSETSKPKMPKPNEPAMPPERSADPMRDSIRYSMPGADDKLPEPDIDTFRFSIVRKIANFVGLPGRCPNGACKRRKLCVGPTLDCNRMLPSGPRTPEEQARIRARILHALRKAKAAHEQGGVSSPPAPARPSPASRDRGRGTSP